MRVLVCGGRDFADRDTVFRALDLLHERRGIDALIQGAADGADRWAAEWAFERGIPCASFPADWEMHGRAAGPIRNAQMLTEGKPNAVVAFPRQDGQIGRGTADMVRQAEAAGLKVWWPVKPKILANAATRRDSY
jgi:hypothetical protein